MMGARMRTGSFSFYTRLVSRIENELNDGTGIKMGSFTLHTFSLV